MFHHLFRTLLVFLLASSYLSAQSLAIKYWTDLPSKDLQKTDNQYIKPLQFRLVHLDINALQGLLSQASDADTEITFSVPAPDGSTVTFVLKETPVMAPELQAKYPEIRCYTGRNVEDATTFIKADLTPQGFHAMVHSPTGDWFIDPAYHGNPSKGLIYFKKDFRTKKGATFSCATQATSDIHALAPSEIGAEELIATPQKVQGGDCTLRTYRLALACTGEYAAFHGGTKPLVLAAMNTSMNRVNGVFEDDVAVTMKIIAKNDTLIFLNGATDPYDNGDGGAMLDQNQTTITARIGEANYDIGHVFSTGGGGVAGLGVVCSNGNKAIGVTGGGSPIGDPFDIDYVAHEMGHQFAANHTQNNNCNRADNASMEPGSASTIMGYAGICAPDVQSNSDAYFHAISLDEINDFITNGGGNTCPVKTILANSKPVVTPIPNYIIPKSTPFALTGIATDPDGDPITFCWEQMDPAVGIMPPVSTSTAGPLFRSFTGTTSPTRVFPRLQDLVNNVNPTWEELPGVARTMNFRLTVRDNNPAGGCTAEDNVLLTVAANAGPFVVTDPNVAGISWFIDSLKTVTWNVTNTNIAPVSCANVRILLSTDGGLTYPIVLKESVPNNGSAVIKVPTVVSTTCRIKVEGIGNIFFDISNQNFSIGLPPIPTFVLLPTTSTLSTCQGTPVSFSVNSSVSGGFNAPVQLALSGLPVGASAQITPNPLPNGQTATITINNLNLPGTYNLTLTGTSGTIVRTNAIALEVLGGQPATAVLSLPADGATGVSIDAVIAWGNVNFASTYDLELSTVPTFLTNTIVLSESVNTSTTTAQGLSLSTVYYWRVRAKNVCGTGPWSAPYAFQTGAEGCNQSFSSQDVPVAIDVNGVVNVASDLLIPSSASITDVDVTMAIGHTWVGDIVVSLVSPGADTIVLIDRPGLPADANGCAENNIAVTMNDEATNTAGDLENACSGTSPAISGSFRPIGALSTFDGQPAQGTWQLLVSDLYPGEDAGSINSWSLNFCLLNPITSNNLALATTPLNVVQGASKVVQNTNLLVSGTMINPAQIQYTLLAIPQNGTLRLNGAPLAVGSTFTQANINAGVLVYVHNGNNAVTDQAIVDILDQNSSNWLHSKVLIINILQNTLAITGSITNAVSCNNGSDGRITISVTGGTAPFSYKLNNGNAQPSNVFNGLNAGNYSVVVTDANGFTSTAGVFVLPNPAAIVVNTAIVFDDLTITATGGTGALTYSVDGTNFVPSNQFNNLSDGTYTVVVRDSKGCTASKQIVVSGGALLASVNITATPLCVGGNQGAIQAQAAGGFSPYAFSLNNGTFQTSGIFTGLVAGTYTVVVRDANNTTATAGTVVINNPVPVVVTAISNLNSIIITANGGTGSLTYSLEGATPQLSNTFTNVANGTYTVTVTDGNGCTATVSAFVNVAALSFVNTTVSPILCSGASFSVVISATGGIPPYEYAVGNGPWQSSNIFDNVDPALLNPLTARVRDAVGTIIETSLVIVQPAAIIGASTVSGNDVVLSAIGGVPPYTFNTSGGLIDVPNGTYAATITDANGCTATTTYSVNYTPPSLFTTVTNVLCFGESNGSIVATVQDGLPPYSYTYNPNISWNGIPAGSYFLTVTDAAGTSLFIETVVTEPDLLALTAAAPGDGTIVSTATGGTAPYTYSLDGVNFQNAEVFQNVAAGNYTITVRDANGCEDTFDLIISSAVEPEAAWGLSVLPNPTSGIVQLRMQQAPTGQLQTTILDATGRTLQTNFFEIRQNEWQASLDLRALPSGIYMIQIRSATAFGVVRLVKE